LVYTRCSILKIFKMPGLVKEALGNLFNLTHHYRYHQCSRGNPFKIGNIFLLYAVFCSIVFFKPLIIFGIVDRKSFLSPRPQY